MAVGVKQVMSSFFPLPFYQGRPPYRTGVAVFAGGAVRLFPVVLPVDKVARHCQQLSPRAGKGVFQLIIDKAFALLLEKTMNRYKTGDLFLFRPGVVSPLL